MNSLASLLACLLLVPAVVVLAQPGADGQKNSKLRDFEPDAEAGSSAAVLVEDVPLIHTAQLLPVDEAGQLVAGDAAAQCDALLDQLETLLKSLGSGLDQAVKLNVYVARDELGQVVRARLAARFVTGRRPAVSLVTTALPLAGVQVALDAVAAAPADAALEEVQLQLQAAIRPAGSRIYISGQAEPGTLREATRKTLESLSASLKHCGRTDRDVVQVKCFLQPMQSVGEVREEIARYYGTNRPLPVSFVEWRSSVPIEIELVAWGGPANSEPAEAIEFVTPPPLKASPLYSRVAVIHRGPTIFFSDLHGAANADAQAQAAEPFGQLAALLAKTGSDLRHLAKATYYVTDDEVSRAHNAVRPKHYDPARPPAASKALVAGTGRPGTRYVMDMIAVPKP
ncbi:MAG: RidA family protein [Pirellulaceae bacterium]